MKYNTPIISIIIVSRNRKFYLKELIKNIEQQSFRYFDVLIVENNSDEATKNYVNSINFKDVLVRKFYLDTEQTISYCRNYPFRNNLIEETVQYIYFIDDDDAIFKTSLESIYFELEKHQAQVAVINPIRVNQKMGIFKNILKNVDYKSYIKDIILKYWYTSIGKLFFKNDYWLVLRHANAAAPLHCFIFQREIFRYYSFKDNITYGEDSLFLFDISPLIQKAIYLPFTFVLYRRHGNNTSDSQNLINKVKVNPFNYKFCQNSYLNEQILIVFYNIYVKNLLFSNLMFEQKLEISDFRNYLNNATKNFKMKLIIYHVWFMIYYFIKYLKLKIMNIVYLPKL